MLRLETESSTYYIEAQDLHKLTTIEKKLDEFGRVTGVVENIFHAMTGALFTAICLRTEMGSHKFTANFGSIILDEDTRDAFLAVSVRGQ